MLLVQWRDSISAHKSNSSPSEILGTNRGVYTSLRLVRGRGVQWTAHLARLYSNIAQYREYNSSNLFQETSLAHFTGICSLVAKHVIAQEPNGDFRVILIATQVEKENALMACCTPWIEPLDVRCDVVVFGRPRLRPTVKDTCWSMYRILIQR